MSGGACFLVSGALLNLLAGSAIGTTMAFAYAGYVPGAALRYRLLHQELMLFGWLFQLALGVGYWILPKAGGRRGSPAAPVAACAVLNASLLFDACAATARVPIPPVAAGGAGIALLLLLPNFLRRLRWRNTCKELHETTS